MFGGVSKKVARFEAGLFYSQVSHLCYIKKSVAKILLGVPRVRQIAASSR